MLAWQALTVTRNYGGNWTALYCTGQFSRVPPALAGGTYRFPGIAGYDGQSYRYVAHDPFFQRGYAAYVEDARLRYARIFVPGLAWFAAVGRQPLIDWTYIGVVAASVFAGVYWMARFAVLHGRAALWGLAFVIAPGTLTSVDRMLVDGAFAALFVAFVYYVELRRDRSIWLVLVCALLTRETGLLMLAGVCLHGLWNRDLRRVLTYASAAVPYAGWLAFVYTHTPPSSAGRIVQRPVYGVVMRLFTVSTYPFPAGIARIVQIFDVLAAAGLLLAFALMIWWFIAKQRGPADIAALLFAVLGLMLGNANHMTDAYGYGRPVTPLLVYLFLRFLSHRILMLALPMLLVSAQIGLYFVHQLAGIIGMRIPHERIAGLRT